MTISEQVVKAMPDRIYAVKRTEGSNCVVSFDTPSLDYNVEYVRADLALPHLPGVGVKKLEWRKYRNGDAEAVTPFGEIYTAYVNGYWRITRNGKAGKFIKATGGEDVDAAKAGAQADYSARILSALEPFANSYPQGANLAAHSKNENGPDHEPSPRAQALEEGDNICARLEGLASWLDGSQHSKWCGRKEVPIHGYSGEGKLVRAAIAAIRALSSQPVANGGSRKFKIGDRLTKNKGSSWTGRVVGFYSTELTPIGYAVESETEKGSVQIYPEAALRPLPASPEVAVCPTCNGTGTEGKNSICRDCDETRPTGASNHGE